ncbi:hypothetical protein GGI23_003466 [Coemansia sp. RSA 2559]|nr:hypothetical protein GGI23_003466 [Coemansia sp. RSA 2559]KAJ2858895.1 hypothetical protein GGI22_003168 [Coemansia erecta]
MSYYRPLGQTFNQLNLHMYRLPDGERGALRSTSLALAREASRDGGYRRPSSDSSSSNSSNHRSYNPFKGIRRLYTGFRKHRSRSGSSDDDSNRLRRFYSTPLTSSKRTPSPPALANAVDEGKTTQPNPQVSGSEARDPTALLTVNEDEGRGRSRSRSSSRLAKRVRFVGGDPEEHITYSSQEYDRRVIDPWEMLTKETRDRMREEMSDYTSHEMVLNNVYNTNDSKYCTLCWRQHCHCRALSKDIWRRARSTNMVRAGA